LQIINDFKQKLAAEPYFKLRTIAVLSAIFLGFCGLWLGFSIFSAFSGIGIFPAGPGMFFINSFGIFSILIPAYFGYAAFILADSAWRPDRIFYLGGAVLPFLTLVIGFAFIRDFEARSADIAFLKFSGKAGFSLLIISLAAAEVIVLQLFKNKFFNKEKQEYRQRAEKKSCVSLPPPENLSENIIEFVPIAADNNFFKCVYKEPVKSELNTNTVNNSADNEADIEELSSDEVYNDYIDEDAIEANEYAEDSDETGDVDETIDVSPHNTSVERLLEEAEAAAAAHGEQVRKKNKQVGSARYKKYRIPVDILNEYPDGEYWVIDQATRDAAIALKETLEEFKIQAEVTGIRKGPVITMFEILPAPGVKLSKIVGLQDNIALRLAASSVRIVAPIPGKHAVGIEVPNAKRNIVSFREIIEGELQKSDEKMGIPVVMGKDISGEAQTVDLVQMPHLLIAGATGSGKSVCVNAIILSILYQLHPNECRLMLIDPKIVELKLYNDIPHLLTPVITEPKKAFQALQYCIYEMERRYACLDNMGVRDIRSYNRRIKEKNIMQEHMPYIVVIIDEFADLMSTTGKELESTVARLAAMSRAVGIHLVLATQRPSIDVITGLIKANIPSRIAFMVASKTDSRIIIDMVGAEKLLGKGDMLYSGVVDPFPIRMQGAFVSEEEVEAVVEQVKSFGEPEYIDDEIFFEEEDEDAGASLFSDGGDPLYEKALEIVYQQGKASASYIQRRLKIGFNRAARLIDEMEHHGVVGSVNGSKPRELLRGNGIA